jgi:hypothetical protein
MLSRHPHVVGDGRRLAAVLACGDGAVLSRRSAATAWGLLRGDGRRIDVVAPGRSGGRVDDRPGIDLRRTRRLLPDDVTVLRDLPITTVGRTLLRQALGITAPDPSNGIFAERFLALCVAHDLPTPRLGIHLDGGDRLYEVDALFPAEPAAVAAELRSVLELRAG